MLQAGAPPQPPPASSPPEMARDDPSPPRRTGTTPPPASRRCARAHRRGVGPSPPSSLWSATRPRAQASPTTRSQQHRARLPATARNCPRLECRPAGRSPQRVQDCRARASPPSSSRLSSGTRRPSSATGSRPSRPRSPTTCAPCDAPAAALPAAPPVCAACPAAAAASGGFAAWTTWPQRTPSRTTATAPKAPPPAPLRHSVERGPDWRRRRARGVAGRRGAVSGRVRAALLCRAHLPLGASRAHTPSSTDTPTN